jgi:hypothetical protein
MTDDERARCRCGHPAATHDHYRPGSDCGLCGHKTCGHYRPDLPPRIVSYARLAWAVATQWSYVVRPYDELADRRRWPWQRPQRCGLPPMPPAMRDELRRAAERLARDQ